MTLITSQRSKAKARPLFGQGHILYYTYLTGKLMTIFWEWGLKELSLILHPLVTVMLLVFSDYKLLIFKANP